MNLSIAIVSWNTRNLLDQCLRSIYETAPDTGVETIVVDNASTDGSADMVRDAYPQVRLIRNTGNPGFASANNQAYRESCGRHFLLLNPDTICLPGALPSLVSFLDQNPRVGAVGPMVLNADRTLQYSWARFPTFGSEVRGVLDRRIADSASHPTTSEETRAAGPFRTDWIGGCALMIRREAVERIGPMDEAFFMYSEETDWCYRLHKAGWEVWVEPDAAIVHLGGQSSRQVSAQCARHLINSKARYFRKHYGWAPSTALSVMLRLKMHIVGMLRRKSG